MSVHQTSKNFKHWTLLHDDLSQKEAYYYGFADAQIEIRQPRIQNEVLPLMLRAAGKGNLAIACKEAKCCPLDLNDRDIQSIVIGVTILHGKDLLYI